MGCFQTRTSCSPSNLSTAGRLLALALARAIATAMSFACPHSGHTAVVAVFSTFRVRPHCSQATSVFCRWSDGVLMASPQTGQTAFSPLLWSKTTMLPHFSQRRLANFSALTSITYPQLHVCFRNLKSPRNV